MSARPPSARSRRRFGVGEAIAVALGIVACIVLVGVPVLADGALQALTIALVAWPAVLLATLFTRWLRRGDIRFALLAFTVALVSIAGLAASVLFV